MSAAARAAIAGPQRARWAPARGQKVVSIAPKRRIFSASHSFRLCFRQWESATLLRRICSISPSRAHLKQMEAISQRLKEFDPDTFQRFCFQLLKERNPELELKHIDGKAGDQGLDVFAGELFGEPAIWQCKAFPNGVGKCQRAQIKESLRTALKHSSPSHWILCLSVDMDVKARRWFEKLKKSYESRVKISDLSAQEIVNEVMHRRDLRNHFFPGAAIDVTALKRLIMKTGEISTEELEQITNANVEDYIERLKERDARFRYEIVFDGESGPPSVENTSIPPGLVMTVSDGTKKINVYARDVTSLLANPPRFKVGFTGGGISKFESLLDTGAGQEFHLDELGPITSDFPLLKSFPITPQKLIVAPSPALTQRKRSVRVIFQKSDAERIQYNLMDMSPLRVGRKEMAFAVSSKRVPLRIEYVLPIPVTPNTTTQVTIQYEDAEHDLREFRKSLDALDLLRPSGELRIVDLETDKPFIVANVELPELTEKQVRSRKLISDLVSIADRFKVDLQLPSRLLRKDLESIALLKRYMENGTIELSDISMTLVKSEENKDSLPQQFANGKGLFRYTNQQHAPVPKIFGIPINTGPIAMDVEAEIRNLPETLEMFRKARVGSGIKVSLRPLGPVRLSLLSEDHNPTAIPA
jgi:hypothetical protein